jgi:hypothetical protein
MNHFNSEFHNGLKAIGGISSFRGPLIQFQIVKSIDRNKGLVRRWTVFSNGKRSTLVKFLFSKWLWDELNERESALFWSLSEITTDLTIYSSLKAKAFGIGKKLIRERLKIGSEYLPLYYISRQQYITLKGRSNNFFIEETVSLRRGPKYSGYTRHHKDHGSLAPERDDYVSEILEPIRDVSEIEEIIFRFLSIGEISFFDKEVIFSPDESKRGRNRK